MQRLILLGTGIASVTECYNTCFAIETDGDYFLVDAGGGNGILAQLKKSGIPLSAVRHIFLSHAHSDHILGMVWMVRMIAAQMRKGVYEGTLRIFCHDELVPQLLTIVRITVKEKLTDLIGDRILVIPVRDRDAAEISAGPLRFFDIRSTKMRQFGFSLRLHNDDRLVFVGDEPYREHEREWAEKATWFLHEAFCLYSQRDLYRPYEMSHVTVKEACEAAESLGVENLILYHTEDDTLPHRKELYTAEGRNFFTGALHVPYDLEEFTLS